MNDAKIAKSRFFVLATERHKNTVVPNSLHNCLSLFGSIFFLSLFDVIFVEINHCLNISFIN